MKSHLSLKSVSVAILMFAVTAAMHEASRTDRLGPQGVTTPIATQLVEFVELLRPSDDVASPRF
jgi:hypothetical protein